MNTQTVKLESKEKICGMILPMEYVQYAIEDEEAHKLLQAAIVALNEYEKRYLEKMPGEDKPILE